MSAPQGRAAAFFAAAADRSFPILRLLQPMPATGADPFASSIGLAAANKGFMHGVAFHKDAIFWLKNPILAGSGVGDRLTEFAMFWLRRVDPLTVAVMGFGIVIVAALALAF